MDDLPPQTPARKTNVKRGMFRLWMLFTVLWAAPLLALSASTWYRAAYYSLETLTFQISEYHNSQTNEFGFKITSPAGCSYFAEDDGQVRKNPKIAFAYIFESLIPLRPVAQNVVAAKVDHRFYQPKTATADLMAMPPMRVRRISRPTAARKTLCSCKAGGTRDHRVRVFSRPCRLRRTTSPSAMR